MLQPILTANCGYPVFLNFGVDPQLLVGRVPAGTELDFNNGATFLSVVGFLSADTVLIGQPPIRQRLFERVQLSFYVRKRNVDDWRRGVVVVREIVPRTVAPVLAHIFVGEPLLALSMRHDLVDRGARIAVDYAWRRTSKWEGLSITAEGEVQPIAAGSDEDFIISRPWQYTALASRVLEYRIEHPRWRLRSAVSWKFDADVFGPEFTETLQGQPLSVFVADGSHIRV
jgi:hypothetical protein